MPYDDGTDAKDRKCPHCKHTQFVDPADAIDVIECEKCKQPASYGSWCNPSDSPHCIAITGETSMTLTENVIKHTIAYTSELDCDDVASGTLVRVGDHLLVATCAHTLEGPISSIGLIGKDRPTRGDRSRWVIRSEQHPNCNFWTGIDVGVIELKPSVQEDLGLIPLSLERVHDAGSGSPVFRTRVIGFPMKSKWSSPNLCTSVNERILG